MSERAVTKSMRNSIAKDTTSCTVYTRRSATSDGPRDAMCQLKSCQLLHNRLGTSCTTNTEQVEVMALEGYSRSMCDKLCASSYDALDRRRVLLTTLSTCRGEYFKIHSLEQSSRRSTLIFGNTRMFS